MFFKESFSRADTLAKAGKARVSGDKKKAVASYKKLLEVNPQEHATRAKMAELQAVSGDAKDAWLNFSVAASGFVRGGFVDKAMGLYAQATRLMPFEAEAWERAAGLQMEKGRKADAVETLFKGSRNFLKNPALPKAERLLRKARELAPSDFTVAFGLSRVLGRLKKTPEALSLLTGLAEREKGKNLKAVRWAVFKLSPGFGTGWMLIKTAFAG